MAEFTAPTSLEIGAGAFITFKGTANKCAYWELVGWDGASETSSVGSLSEIVTVNDVNGFSVNRYVASENASDVGKVERIKVSESA